MQNVTKIGERIKELREKKGITQQALADALSVTRSTINMWENGGRDLKTDAILSLADFFNVTTDYLLCRTENGTVSENIQIACETTGLSDKAVELFIVWKNNLVEMSKKEGGNHLNGFSKMIELFLEDGSIVILMAEILCYLITISSIPEEMSPMDIISHLETAIEIKKTCGSTVIDPEEALSFSEFRLQKAFDKLKELSKKIAPDVFCACYGTDISTFIDQQASYLHSFFGLKGSE